MEGYTSGRKETKFKVKFQDKFERRLITRWSFKPFSIYTINSRERHREVTMRKLLEESKRINSQNKNGTLEKCNLKGAENRFGRTALLQPMTAITASTTS